MSEWTNGDDTCIIQIKHTSYDFVPYYHARDTVDALEDYVGDYEELGFICNVEFDDDACYDETGRYAEKKWDKFVDWTAEQNEKYGHKRKWISSNVWFECLTNEELRDFLLQFSSEDEEDDEEEDDDEEDYDSILSRARSFARSVWSFIWEGSEIDEENYQEGAEIYCEYNYE